MTRDEIVTALRFCSENAGCNECPIGFDNPDCIEKMAGLAADLIENQQNHIAALLKANDSLKDAIARRDKQIEDMNHMLDKMPTIDAVPVVRCKDCVNGTFCLNSQGAEYVDCMLDDYSVRKPDDFCSYGERKEGADNG